MSYENDMNILRKIKEIREGTQADSARSPEGEKPFIGDDQLASDLAEAAIEVRLNIGAKLYNDEDVQEKRDLSERLDLHAITRIRSTEASTDGRVAKARRLLWEEAEAVCPDDPDRQYDIILHEQIRRADAAPPSTPDGEVGWDGQNRRGERRRQVDRDELARIVNQRAVIREGHPYPGQRSQINKEILGALRSTIGSHGPVTLEFISSASKRITAALYSRKKRDPIGHSTGESDV